MFEHLVINGEDARRRATNLLARVPVDELHEFVLKPWKPPMTKGQRGVMRMWHGEVAAELCARTGHAWTGDDVHELIFLPKFMPREEIEIAPGQTVIRYMRTSDFENNREITAEAMAAYEAWCCGLEIEITHPDPGKRQF